MKLPGQKEDVSPELETAINKFQNRYKMKLEFVMNKERVGDYWSCMGLENGKTRIELPDGVSSEAMEYFTGHELGHCYQIKRGLKVVKGYKRVPAAENIARKLSDFVTDPLADRISESFGIKMRRYFDKLMRSEIPLESIKHPQRGRRWGSDWPRLWEKLEEITLAYRLGVKEPKLPREYWTATAALDFANVISRARNLESPFGDELFDAIGENNGLKILKRVVDDILSVGYLESFKEKRVEIIKYQAIMDYLKVEPGFMVIINPKSGRFLMDGHWRKPQR